MFQELKFDACSQGSNSSFSDSFLCEVLSSVTDRMSDKTVELHELCSRGFLLRVSTDEIVNVNTRNDSNQRTECTRSVRDKVPSLSQQHRQGSHKIQVHTKQHPQVPTFRFVPCPTLPNTISTQFTPDEIQRVATKKNVFPTTSLSEMMSAPARNETRQRSPASHVVMR